MRISDWSSTCALPIYLVAAAVRPGVVDEGGDVVVLVAGSQIDAVDGVVDMGSVELGPDLVARLQRPGRKHEALIARIVGQSDSVHLDMERRAGLGLLDGVAGQCAVPEPDIRRREWQGGALTVDR